MEKIEVIPTERVENEAQLLRSQLKGIVDPSPGPIIIRKSLEDIPQYIYIVAALPIWVAFIGAESFLKSFFGRLGEASADVVIENVKGGGQPPEGAAKLAAAITIAHQSSLQKFQAILKVQLASGDEIELPLPDDREHIIHQVTIFLALCDEVAAFVQGELEDGRGVVSPTASVGRDGVLVLDWYDEHGKQRAEFRL